MHAPQFLSQLFSRVEMQTTSRTLDAEGCVFVRLPANHAGVLLALVEDRLQGQLLPPYWTDADDLFERVHAELDEDEQRFVEPDAVLYTALREAGVEMPGRNNE